MRRLIGLFLAACIPLGCAAPGPMMKEFDTDPDLKTTYVWQDDAPVPAKVPAAAPAPAGQR